MGFSKHRRRVREATVKWGCLGYFGYGQGRSVAEFGDKAMKGKSACFDICKKSDACNLRHHARMDKIYPQLAAISEQAVKIAIRSRTDVAAEVVDAMQRAFDLGIDDAIEHKKVLDRYGVTAMTDHYRSGMFDNLQRGLDKSPAIPVTDEKAEKAS